MLRRLKNSRNIPYGLSFPVEIIQVIDKERGDVTRSKYVLRLIEQSIQTGPTDDSNLKNKKLPVDQSLEAQNQQVSIVKGEN